jgi:hypothetical protein
VGTTPVPIPTSRQATLAWRSLSPQARDDAWAAAREGRAPADLGVAYAAVGYGQTVAGRLLVALVLVSLVSAPVTVAVLIALLFSDAGRAAGPLVFVTLLAAYVGCVILLQRKRRRFQRLYNSGMLAIEAASLRPLQQVPVGIPSAPGSDTPVAAGPRPDPAQTRTVRIRTSRVVLSIAILAAAGLVMWARFIGGILAEPVNAVDAVLRDLLATLMVTGTVLIGLLIVVNARYLVDPVVARFTAEGWELPRRRMHGSWPQVRVIRIRAVGARWGGVVAAQAVGARVVALVVDDPERYLAQASPLARVLGRGAMRRYGSLITIAARPGWTVPLPELVAMLRDYTDAPLDWG